MWQSKNIILGDGAVNVRDDDFIVPVPQVDGSFAAACALVLGGDAKRHVIRPLLQFQAGLVTQTTVKASESECDPPTCIAAEKKSDSLYSLFLDTSIDL